MASHNVFTDIQMRKPSTATFDLSHDVKTSFNMGELVPITHSEVLPGDTFKMRTENLLRFMPLIAPVMHKVNVTVDYFFVPNRILWKQFENFITNTDTPVPPFMQLERLEVGSKGDYFGLPLYYPVEGNPLNVSVLPFAAYQKIFDDWYRDQNLIEERLDLTNLDSGLNNQFKTYSLEKCLRRSWQHDYFTSCLPFAQKGEAVSIPLTYDENIPVIWKNATDENPRMRVAATGIPSGSGTLTTTGSAPVAEIVVSGNTQRLGYDPQGTLVVDINSDAVDINSFRTALRLQEWLERNARGGTRYTELIWAHFLKKSSDARLQRSEWIGRHRQNMVISEVLSTAQTETESGSTPVGQMAGHAISAGNSKTFSYTAEEHGHILVILNVQPITSYLSQGIHRSWQRFTNLDYAWPTFAHIGEQPVYTKELYVSATQNPEETFGYIPRYSEYRYMNSRVTGDLRDTLEFWTMSRKFETQPVLNEDFITARPPNWSFAFEDEEEDYRHIIIHSIHHWKVNRRLPKYGVPTL